MPTSSSAAVGGKNEPFCYCGRDRRPKRGGARSPSTAASPASSRAHQRRLEANQDKGAERLPDFVPQILGTPTAGGLPSSDLRPIGRRSLCLPARLERRAPPRMTSC